MLLPGHHPCTSVLVVSYYKELPSLKLTAIAPENGPKLETQKERMVVFQQKSIFRCELAVSFTEGSYCCNYCFRGEIWRSWKWDIQHKTWSVYDLIYHGTNYYPQLIRHDFCNMKGSKNRHNSPCRVAPIKWRICDSFQDLASRNIFV